MRTRIAEILFIDDFNARVILNQYNDLGEFQDQEMRMLSKGERLEVQWTFDAIPPEVEDLDWLLMPEELDLLDTVFPDDDGDLDIEEPWPGAPDAPELPEEPSFVFSVDKQLRPRDDDGDVKDL